METEIAELREDERHAESGLDIVATVIKEARFREVESVVSVLRCLQGIHVENLRR